MAGAGRPTGSKDSTPRNRTALKRDLKERLEKKGFSLDDSIIYEYEQILKLMEEVEASTLPGGAIMVNSGKQMLMVADRGTVIKKLNDFNKGVLPYVEYKQPTKKEIEHKGSLGLGDVLSGGASLENILIEPHYKESTETGEEGVISHDYASTK